MRTPMSFVTPFGIATMTLPSHQVSHVADTLLFIAIVLGAFRLPAQEPRVPPQGPGTLVDPLAPPTGKVNSGISIEDLRAKHAEADRKRREEFERYMTDNAALPESARADKLMISASRSFDYYLKDFTAERREEILSRKRFRESSLIGQEFVATAWHLVSVSVRLDNAQSTQLRVREVSSGQVIGSAESKPGSTMNSRSFDPPLPMQPGNVYRVEVERTDGEKLGCYLEPGTPFGHFIFRDANGKSAILEGARSHHDLVMDVRARDFVEMPAPAAAPSQRALLVLLDQAGLVRQAQELGNLQVAVYSLPNLTPPIELLKDQHETLAELLARNESSLSTWARLLAPPLAQRFLDEAKEEFSDPSPEYLAAVAAQDRLISSHGQALMQPKNWRVERRPAAELEAAVQRKLKEQLTADAIRAKAGPHYDTMVILEGESLVLEGIIENVAELSTRHRLDLHVLTGGSPLGIVLPANAAGQPAYLDTDSFFRPLRQLQFRSASAPRLESVYVAGDHSHLAGPEWMGLGLRNLRLAYRTDFQPSTYADFLTEWAKDGVSGKKSFHQCRELAEARAAAEAKELAPFLVQLKKDASER